MKTKDMTLTAVMAALICIAGPLSIFIGPIPLSLATFAVYLSGAALGKKRGTAAVGLYLLIGIIGVPVFSGFSGGFQKLAGVTGGYLVGYLPCALLSGIGAEWAEKRNRPWILPVMMAAGTGEASASCTACARSAWSFCDKSSSYARCACATSASRVVTALAALVALARALA